MPADLIKAAHVIATISWMAGLLYFPRLLAFHCQLRGMSLATGLLEMMEWRVYFYLMLPAMLISFVTGIWLIADHPNWLGDGWLLIKLLLVFVLLYVHWLIGKWRGDFFRNRNRHSEFFYRLSKEIPVLALIGIVALVIIKPF